MKEIEKIDLYKFYIETGSKLVKKKEILFITFWKQTDLNTDQSVIDKIIFISLWVYHFDTYWYKKLSLFSFNPYIKRREGFNLFYLVNEKPNTCWPSSSM